MSCTNSDKKTAWCRMSEWIRSRLFFSSVGSATVQVGVAELCLQAPIRYIMAAVNIIYTIKWMTKLAWKLVDFPECNPVAKSHIICTV